MQKTDDNGSWEIKEGVKILLEPSPKWIAENRKEKTDDEKWEDVRRKRNQLLSESDWTQLLDAPKNKQGEWVTYRQLLRDITKQSLPVIFPEKPV